MGFSVSVEAVLVVDPANEKPVDAAGAGADPNEKPLFVSEVLPNEKPAPEGVFDASLPVVAGVAEDDPKENPPVATAVDPPPKENPPDPIDELAAATDIVAAPPAFDSARPGFGVSHATQAVSLAEFFTMQTSHCQVSPAFWLSKIPSHPAPLLSPTGALLSAEAS